MYRNDVKYKYMQIVFSLKNSTHKGLIWIVLFQAMIQMDVC